MSCKHSSLLGGAVPANSIQIGDGKRGIACNYVGRSRTKKRGSQMPPLAVPDAAELELEDVLDAELALQSSLPQVRFLIPWIEGICAGRRCPDQRVVIVSSLQVHARHVDRVSWNHRASAW